MKYSSYLLRSFNVLNVVLALAAVFFVWRLLLPTVNVKVKYTLPAVKKKVIEETKVEVAKPQAQTPADYVIIAEQNLFHPERRIPPDKKAEAAAPLPMPEFVLYGTLITDGLRIAYMEDKKSPQSTPGRGKRQSSLMVGEHLSGFTVKEIDADKVLMVRGEEKITVPLNTSKTRETIAAQPAQPAGNVPPQAGRAPAPGQQPAVPPAPNQAIAPGRQTLPGAVAAPQQGGPAFLRRLRSRGRTPQGE